MRTKSHPKVTSLLPIGQAKPPSCGMSFDFRLCAGFRTCGGDLTMSVVGGKTDIANTR